MPTTNHTEGNSRRALVAIAPSAVELELIEGWRHHHAPEASIIELPYPKRTVDADWLALGKALTEDEELELVPVRVLWLPEDRDGRRTARLVDLVSGDPRKPSPKRQRRLAQRGSERHEVVSGESAPVRMVDERWRADTGADPGDLGSFARYTARSAVLALERAVNEVIGAEYKVPRLVREQIQASSRWAALTDRMAQRLHRPTAEVQADADRYLTEMVAGRSRRLIDFSAQVYGAIYRQGYDPQIDYDPEQIQRVKEVTAKYPIVVLPSHRSNLDAMVMPLALQEHGLPRTHTLAGINMAFWPVGPVFRKAGAIFIRRNASDNPLYRAVLREYVGFLMEKRFGLQWYLEGGRSRTGKMLPPKMGLLGYVADAYREGRTDDVALVPASIAYEQLAEVSEYASEAKGMAKEAEGFRWLYSYVQAQRQRFGKIYIRFAEPVLLSDALGPAGESAATPDEKRLALQKLGLEVAWRINSVTPATPTAMVTMALLATDGRALTVAEITEAVRWPLDHAVRRDLPMTGGVRSLEDEDAVRHVLDELARHGVVRRHDGPLALYQIGSEQHLEASYYRNSVVHFFLVPAIVELALVAASRSEADGADLAGVVHREALALRDLLKFDFFFEERERFLQSVDDEMALLTPEWPERLAEGASGVETLLALVPAPWAPVVLRPFLESYWVVADGLRRESALGEFDSAAFLDKLPDHGNYGLLRGWIVSPEAVSKHLFVTGLELAAHRQLTDNAHPETVARRDAFADELRSILDRVELLAASRVRVLDLECFQTEVRPSMSASIGARQSQTVR